MYQKTVFWVRIGPQFMKFTYPTFNSVKQRQKRTFAVTLKIFFSFHMTILAGPDPAPRWIHACTHIILRFFNIQLPFQLIIWLYFNTLRPIEILMVILLEIG